MSKMYIVVLDEVPSHIVPCLVGHAVLRHHMFSYNQKGYDDWFKNSFKKCVVKANRKQFERVRELNSEEFPITISWENNTLNGETSCITVIVHNEVPNVLKYAKLWKPDYPQEIEAEQMEESIKEFWKEIRKSKESCINFLYSAGIVHKDGSLREEYRK